MTVSTEPQPPASPDVQRHVEESLASVREALLGIKFGTVLLTIHEGRVVQIDVTEKTRLKSN